MFREAESMDTCGKAGPFMARADGLVVNFRTCSPWMALDPKRGTPTKAPQPNSDTFSINLKTFPLVGDRQGGPSKESGLVNANRRTGNDDVARSGRPR